MTMSQFMCTLTGTPPSWLPGIVKVPEPRLPNYIYGAAAAAAKRAKDADAKYLALLARPMTVERLGELAGVNANSAGCWLRSMDGSLVKRVEGQRPIKWERIKQ